jgi:thioredoxin 1
MENNTEIILETRTDLVDFLKSTQYEYTILKFYADWCAPCKHIGPKVHSLVEQTAQKFSNEENKFIFIEVNVDECFDLYAFLKSKKMVRGIPTMFLYSKKVYENVEDNHKFIPQASVSGTKENEIQMFFNHIQ